MLSHELARLWGAAKDPLKLEVALNVRSLRVGTLNGRTLVAYGTATGVSTLPALFRRTLAEPDLMTVG